jgi:hypothetical protein
VSNILLLEPQVLVRLKPPPTNISLGNKMITLINPVANTDNDSLVNGRSISLLTSKVDSSREVAASRRFKYQNNAAWQG